MGLAQLPEISRRLIEAGLPESTPAMAISNGTTEGQSLCRATLSALPARVLAENLASPTLIIIGRVVAVSDALRDAAEAETSWPTSLEVEPSYA